MKLAALFAIAIHALAGAWVYAIDDAPPPRERTVITIKTSKPPPPKPPEPKPAAPEPEEPAPEPPKPAPKPEPKKIEPPKPAPSSETPAPAAPAAPPNFGVKMAGDGTGGTGVPGGTGPAVGGPGCPPGTAAADDGTCQPIAKPQPKVVAPPAPVADACTEKLVKPKPIKVVQPAFTQAAQDAGIEGKVRVEIAISATGAITGVKVIEGLGHGLDEAALEAARQSEFAPATKCDEPTATTFVIGMRFQK